MPQVGNKQFDYDEEGMAAANAAASNTGQEVAMSNDPASYMGDMDSRLAAATDLLSAAEEELPREEVLEEADNEEPEGEINIEIITSIFEYMNDRSPNMEDPNDVAEVELIKNTITPDMAEDLQNQEISLVDAVLQVHRAKELGDVAPVEEAGEEENQTFFT
tara:strand:- start:2893 stop:3378 length:486 start_codon:yes stop_codon:yes gene_type:complete